MICLRPAALLASSLLFALTACAAEEEEPKRQPPLVGAVMVKSHEFVEQIEAVGTARANEQVTIAAPVTERIDRILFTDGMRVSRGQLLAVLSQGQQTASLAGAVASQKQATAQNARIQSLFDRGFSTRAQLEQQQAAAERARADAAAARADISDRMIRAPFAGITSLRTISAGAIVSAGTPIVTVSDISRIKLDFTVPETRLANLRAGQDIQAIAAAFPDRTFGGRVATIDPVIDPETRAVMVRALVPNPGGLIKPGMLLNVRVRITSRVADAVPELAVMGEREKRYVYIVGRENKVARVEVKTGLRDAGLIEVTGLPAGARVIHEGVRKVSEGSKVRLAGEGGAAPKDAAGSGAPGAAGAS